MITVNNFFGHWLTDIDIRWYPDNMMILPTSNSVSIANYSNAEMKHLPIKSVKKLLKTMLYYNIAVYNDDNIDRRSHDSTTDDDVWYLCLRTPLCQTYASSQGQCSIRPMTP